MRTIANPGRSLLNGCALLPAVLSAGFAGPLCAEDFDLVLPNGRLIDPESKLDAGRNVGGRDGVIRSVSAEPRLGRVTVDIGVRVGHIQCRMAVMGPPPGFTPGRSVRSPLVAE